MHATWRLQTLATIIGSVTGDTNSGFVPKAEDADHLTVVLFFVRDPRRYVSRGRDSDPGISRLGMLMHSRGSIAAIHALPCSGKKRAYVVVTFPSRDIPCAEKL